MNRNMRRTWFGIATAAALLASACGGGSYKTNFKQVTIRGDVKEDPPPPKPVAQPVERGDKIQISDKIHFRSSSAKIRKRSHKTLDEVVQVMNENPNIVVEIQGHTDARGSDRRNRRLSSRRARKVQEYLIKRGIDPRRIEAVGHGEEQPVANNRTREGRYTNRRVDFVVIRDDWDGSESSSTSTASSFEDEDEDEDDDADEDEDEDNDF